MSKLYKIFLVALIALGFSSCGNDFLSYSPSGQIPVTGAFSSARDVSNALNGIYYDLGQYQFLGRNVLALGDAAADNTFMDGTSGHLYTIYNYSITEQEVDLRDIWADGYNVIEASTRLINGGNALVAKSSISSSDKSSIENYIAQAYATRALSEFYLVNIFGLPYVPNDQATNDSNLGIVLIKNNTPIEWNDKPKRSSITETYNQILSDIAAAKDANTKASTTSSKFMLNPAAISGLEARVALYMGDYSTAITAAQSAIALSKGSIVTDPTAYGAMWRDIATTSEDIFTIGKTADDNLSANSLNTLYSDYGGWLTTNLASLYSKDDMRYQLITKDSKTNNYIGYKYLGLPASKAVSNIPIIRLPEMYLILAEAYAKNATPDFGASANNLFTIAKRNPNIKSTSDLPSDKAGLLDFIAKERRRELEQEGHRWFDMRRTGELLTRAGIFSNYDVSKFAYPIPLYEVNATSGSVSQNTTWSDNLPSK